MMRLIRLTLLVGALGLASACSHLPELPQMPGLSGPQATPGLSPRDRVNLAVELLDAGDQQRAELELRAALEEQPANSAARRLLQQITDDPRTLLTGAPRVYTVRQGDSMSALAQRFQGDPLLFYALARFNNLTAPNQISAGQRLLIPVRPELATASTPSGGVAPAAPAAPAMQLRSGDPERANRLRLQGLQQLNTGNIDAAITLLGQAQALDPGNPAIQRDIDRAQRLRVALAAGRG